MAGEFAGMFEERERREREAAELLGLEVVGTVGSYLRGELGFKLDRPLWLYVEAGGRGMLRVDWVSDDRWVHTEGNGGFGQSWCCHGGTRLYGRKA